MTYKEIIRAEIERRMKCFKNERNTITKASDNNLSLGARIAMCGELLSFIDSLQEKSVSKDLEEAINAYIGHAPDIDESSSTYGKRQAFKAGAEWQKEHLWKPADGDDLPEYEREVVVLIQPYPLEKSEYAVSFAHRPNPDGWDGKSLSTGKVEHYTPKTYDKCGWNIPDVKYWLDVELPKEIEL